MLWSSSYDMNESENKAPISSFYSSYSKDEDLSASTNFGQPTNNMQNGIASFFLSGGGAGGDGENVDTRTRNEEEDKDSASTSSYKASSSGMHATGGESWRSGDKTDMSGSLGRKRSLERNVKIKEPETDSVRETDDPRKITLEDTNILRRALERKQASNSLERERLSKTFSGDDGSDPSNPASRAYVSFLSERSEKDSPQGTADDYPKTRSSVTTTYDLGYRRNTRAGNDDVTNRIKTFEVAAERLGRPTRSTYSVEFPGSIRTRSRSSESLDDSKRSRLGIYQELPGREEFLSYSRSLSNTGTSRSDEGKGFSRDDRRTGSLDRYASSRDYKREDDRDSRASLLRLRSRSSEDLRSVDKDKENEMYPRYRSRYLPRQGSIEREDRFGRDVTNRRDIGRREMSPSSQGPRSPLAEILEVKWDNLSEDKLREDIAKLKFKTESRETKRGDIKLYSFSREPSIQDKLKEDIAKLKAETLTRDHGRPYIPPPSSRTESENVSSRWKRREPSIQDKLKEDIAKLKAETRSFPSRPGRASGVTTEMIIPGREMEDRGNVRRRGLARTSIERYHLSKRDGDVFKDEQKNEETQRYGKVEDLKDYNHKHGTLRMEDKPVSRDELAYAERDIRDEVFPGSSRERFRPTRDHGVSSPGRPSEGAPPTYFSRTRHDDSSMWPRADESRLTERNDSQISPRNEWDDPKRTSWESRTESTQGYASKKVFRADSTVSISSTKDAEGGPSSVRGFYHGSVSKEDHSAYFHRQKSDNEDGYPESSRVSEHVRRPDEAVPAHLRRPVEAIAEAVSQPDETIPEPVRRTSGIILEPVRRPSETIPEHVSGPDEAVPEALSQPDELIPVSVRRPSGTLPEPLRRPDEAIPLPYTGYEIISPRREDSVSSLRELRDEQKQKDKEERKVHSEKVHSSREFVTRKTIRDSDVSRESFKDDAPRLPSTVDTSRRFSERSEPQPRRTSIREEIKVSEENRIPYYREVVAPIPEYKDTKPSGMSELRKKIEQLKSKVDSLDDTRARMQLEKYVDEHSEKKPDVEIKDPVKIKRYQLSERSTERTSVVDGADPLLKRASIDVTSESISRQISRQTSHESSIRRISSIREEDLRATPRTQVVDESPDEVFPKVRIPDEKPTVQVLTQTRDAETMTAPEVQEHVGADVIRRQESIVSSIVDEPDNLDELRGVPIDHRERRPQIEEVGTGQGIDSGITTIQIDNQQQTLSPKKDTQGWWNAFTAEDVDRLLELGNWGPWNAYTAEDVDKMFQLGPVRRRSLRRGSHERRSFRRYPRRSRDELVDVHVRVRGRQEKRSRPQCIIAQAAPEEKAIVLRDVKESADPFISKIKVDDVYGADAVRVENGVVKIKVGDLTSKGRRAWARILQQKNRIIESDGTVTVPVSHDHYEDGVYRTNYYQRQEQDGTMRVPIKFKVQEQNKALANKLRVVREMKRAGSLRRKRRAAGSRAYIVGARYYSGNLMLTSADGYRSQGNQREIVLRQPQGSSKVTGREIVLRRGSQPTAFPMQTVQRIHEGHKITRQATSCRNEDGKMVITVHAVPPQTPKFNLKQVGENMTRTSEMLTSGSFHGSTLGHRGVSNTSGNYYVSSSSGGGGMSGAPRGYVTTSTSGRQGNQGTSYFVTDPTDSIDRRLGKPGYHGVTRVYTSNNMSSTPTIIPYEDDLHPSRRGTLNDSFIADPIYGYYDAPGSRIVVSDPRLNARTGYGEKFNLQDHGGISSVQYVNGARQGSRIINEKMNSNGRYRYGSSWNTKQQTA
ncbi:hypothetical protein ACROYT_G043207 [Oculina patagonica]